MTLASLGPYTIERCLGRGGMGTVYAGVHQDSGQRVAVKVVTPGLSNSPSLRERFATEIETLTKLRHPNIVQLYGWGEQQGQLFYAMELIEGRSLSEELQAGRHFHWRDVVRIGVQVCQALKHAHDRGVIHRDLKPANLLATKDDQVKLTDFGIAKLYGASQLTSEGGVLGTAQYMSPEQAEGKPVAIRSDLYSLGASLFTLLTRRPPFIGDSIPKVLHSVRYDDPPQLRQLAAEVPAEFERIIMQLLSKDPQQRIATALAVANRLRAMDYALSVETQVERSAAEDVADAAAGPPDKTVGLQGSQKPGDGTKFDSQVDHQQGTHDKVTVGATDMIPNSKYDLKYSEAATPPDADTTFTTFDAERRLRVDPGDDDQQSLGRWLTTAAMVLVMGVIIWLIWMATRPPGADQLYQQISKAADDGVERLVDVEDAIQSFLDRFPNDDRHSEVAGLQHDLELYRLQRRFERRASRGASAGALEPVERVYLEAVRLFETDPEQAARRLEAMLAVFPPEQVSTVQGQRCLQLAREQLPSLREQVERIRRENLQPVWDQLQRADQLRGENAPLAQEIYQGVITLYADKAWADEAVQHARRALEQ